MDRFARVIFTFALLAPLPVLAQDGWAAYADQEFEISGVVQSPINPGGPRVSFTLRDDMGQMWDVTLARVGGAMKRLNEKTLPVDARVTVHGHRHRDLKLFEVKAERIVYDRGVYNVYPKSADHLLLNGVYYSRMTP